MNICISHINVESIIKTNTPSHLFLPVIYVVSQKLSAIKGAINI